MILFMNKLKNVFFNRTIDKSQLKLLIKSIFDVYGPSCASLFADKLKELGFYFATKAGISLSIEDLKVPPNKNKLLLMVDKEIKKTEVRFNRAEITAVERFQKIIDSWNNASETLKNQMVNYFKFSDPLNPIYIMAFSGARGNLSQVRQLVGMRGLMADPNGQIIDLPILTNFREGLTVTEYLISSYGARKGLVDTSLRTADSGYLTRRLVDVAQDIIVREKDCGSQNFIILTDMYDNDKLIIPIKKRLLGRVSASDLYDDIGNLIISTGELFTEIILDKLSSSIQVVKVRSPFTCKSNRSICQKCYGSNLTSGKIVDLGEAIGIIAAQSIGEPGTQLTMRTFHTGGVFTGEFAKSVKAPFEGVFHYPSNLKFRSIRTRHGDESIILENSAKFQIIAKNSYVEYINLNSGAVLFIQNKALVNKNQIIAEFTTTRRLITEKATKDIISDISGEIYFASLVIEEKIDKQSNIIRINRQGGLIWVLAGEVYQIPSAAQLVVSDKSKILKGSALAKEFIKSPNNGLIRIINNNYYYSIDIVMSHIILNRAYVYIKQVGINYKYIMRTFYNEDYTLIVEPGQLLNNSDVIAELDHSSEYSTQTGGIITYINLNLINCNVNNREYIITGNGKILFVPQETHEINKDISLLLVKTGQYVEKGTEIIRNKFSKNSGFVEVIESNDIIKEIIIKPGYLLRKNIYDCTLIEINNLDKRFFFPGDIILNNFKVEHTIYLEVINSNLLIRPVQVYEVGNSENLDFSYNMITQNGLKLNLSYQIISHFQDGEVIKSVEGVNLIKKQIIILFTSELLKSEIILELSIDKLKSTPIEKFYELGLLSRQRINIKNHKEQNICSQILVHTNQMVRYNEVLAEIQTLSNHTGLVVFNKLKQFQKYNKLLVITHSTSKIIPVNRKDHNLKLGELVHIGDRINNSIKFDQSGQIIDINENSFILRFARPYLISSGAFVYVNQGDFIYKGDTLALLVFERIKTGDIIQGLPRVEEILEARKPKEACQIARCSGYLNVNYDDNKGIILSISSHNMDNITYTLRLNQKNLLSHGNFVEVGDILTDGYINPHELLEIFFNFYLKDYNLAYAVKLSFEKIQVQLLKEVQQVYQSQGVDISDKHIEVIIRQMTSKVLIEEGGDTTLLPGELIEVNRIENINNMIILSKGTPALYKPVLLGITKASLNTDSFISAASFQETTRILTEAAIEGKMDWLRGLKENVIIGRLIPAGTGFDSIVNTDKSKSNLRNLQITSLKDPRTLDDILLE
uniref:DNA-directed RNA polymerase n=1 Tax=Cyanidium sp. THAL103 TaxID=3027999 RepID=A0A9Y1I441_9RHOD|nr:RNA polymerase beta'' subunit [Cyanidium sp. THAL103]